MRHVITVFVLAVTALSLSAAAQKAVLPQQLTDIREFLLGIVPVGIRIDDVGLKARGLNCHVAILEFMQQPSVFCSLPTADAKEVLVFFEHDGKALKDIRARYKLLNKGSMRSNRRINTDPDPRSAFSLRAGYAGR